MIVGGLSDFEICGSDFWSLKLMAFGQRALDLLAKAGCFSPFSLPLYVADGATRCLEIQVQFRAWGLQMRPKQMITSE